MRTIPNDISCEALTHLASLPQEIPVIHGPLRGPVVAGDTTRYDGIECDSEHAHDYQRARDYLSYGQYTLTPEEAKSSEPKIVNLGVSDPVMRSAFLRLEDNTFDIIDDEFPKTWIEVKNATAARMQPQAYNSFRIDWPSRNAVMTSDGKGISPAMILGHEVIHANHDIDEPELFNLRCITPEDLYTNREEKFTIARENVTALILGEGFRQTHFGTDGLFTNLVYPVVHPMSTEQKRKFLIKKAEYCKKIYTTDLFKDQSSITVGEELAQKGSGWNQYISEQRENASFLHVELKSRSWHAITHLPLSERLSNVGAIIHDVQFLFKKDY